MPETLTATTTTTVFEDKTSFNAKHPLKFKWTLWFDVPSKGPKSPTDNWLDNVKKLVVFDSIEDFWGTHNNIIKPSLLPLQANYHLFKEGILPMWEDESNKAGGKWTITVMRKKGNDIDKIWLFTVLACIGEQFDDSDEICGAVVSLRRGSDRVTIWTKTAMNKEATMAIGRKLKGIVGVTESMKYEAHSKKETLYSL